MRETGNLTSSHCDTGRSRTKRTSALEEAVLEEVDETPNISIRNLAHNLHVDCSSILGILKQEKYDPYHYTKVQVLTRDFPQRVNFC
ncbi:hypothetical protein BDFB_014652 [Asbolus verrucosus]|uniref:HTH 24 domain containing protein n=1 Tax=Asbolus verrucosus TaxID=1661398 RepID=A0A482VGI8_ASBVE|nr:hypothetical protein BDFB_014652 [Asbolus verrucosus]